MTVKGPETIIETARLRLRMFCAADHCALLEIMSDPATFRFSDRAPMTGEETWSRILRQAGHWALLGYGLFAIEEKASGRLVGEAGLGDFHRALGQGFDEVPEAAWTIAPWAQRRGYASEAAGAALDWMENRFRTRRTVCLIHADNAPSLRVAHKLGYRAYGELDYRGYAAILHERVSPILP